ncbi:Transcriptional regulatory moc3 [Fusarium albosuccineum]|uniref:Transcriptional regulatory moc3 n=1 Tax=Fusarium albosuccineum TaxID=1237068 RepID=A0A8H4PC71_9HYPO|nr:Transcriptional regulatory moc3 [Fusarium albosuccineum]
MFRNCRTCREGHRKCDRARPRCRTCWKNGFDCKGYEREGQVVFVNFDSSTIESSRKVVLSRALNHARTDGPSSTNHSRLVSHSLYSDSLNSLDLTALDFQNHLLTLWDHFHLSHSYSSDAWAPSFAGLISRNRFLDLALIALSSLRVSQTIRDNQARIMSLTAYGESLRLFRNYCESREITKTPHVAVTLATASLVYTLFEAMHETPATIFSSGMMFKNRHMKGAILFTQLCGPQTFTTRENHLVFKKLREMVILDAYCTYKKSFLTEPRWMNGPWKDFPKTTRDRLFDVAALLTGSISDTIAHNQTRGEKETKDVSQELQTLETGLDSWYSSWYKGLSCKVQAIVLELQQDPSSVDIAFDKNKDEVDVVFLLVEYWALRLLLQLCSLCLHACFSVSDGCENRSLELECSELAEKLRAGLRQRIYGQSMAIGEGITEGQCRSLLPAWALIAYERHCEGTAMTRK